MDSFGMKTMLIVWHSRTGTARQMARRARAGARAVMRELDAGERLDIVMKRADRAEPEDLLGADGYLFCAPENLAALSGAMKEFFDRNYYAVLDRLNGRPYALLIGAGTDGTNAARQMARICTGWRLRPIADPLIVITGAQTPEAIAAPKSLGSQDQEACENLGGTLAALLL